MVRVYRQEKSPLRSWIEEDMLYLHPDDVPTYQKKGSIVRNSFFWALRSIAAQSPMGKAWEFERAVWFALQRMLMTFTDSGYLGTRETQLEFREDDTIPALLQTMATWIPAAEFDPEPEPEPAHYWEDEPDDSLPSALAGPSDTEIKKSNRQKRSSFKRKVNKRPEPEERPAPPYSSYIKKQP